MEKPVLNRKQIILAGVAVFVLLILCFGFGYFFGRYEQVERNRALPEVVPEVNCGAKAQIANIK